MDPSNFLSQTQHPKPPKEVRRRDQSKCNTTVGAYDGWCPEERTQRVAIYMSETNSGSQNMVMRVLKTCQLLPTAILKARFCRA